MQKDTMAIEVPETDGPPVMIDGVFAPGEWDDASSITTSDGTTFYAKQEKGDLFVGIRCAADLVAPAVNLFLQPSGDTIYQLHASAQMGEIALAPPDEVDPPLRSGFSPGWTANVVRWDQARVQELTKGGMDPLQAQIEATFPFDGYEFQIRQDRFDGPRWRIRFEVISTRGVSAYPAGTERKRTSGWMTLVLADGAGGQQEPFPE